MRAVLIGGPHDLTTIQISEVLSFIRMYENPVVKNRTASVTEYKPPIIHHYYCGLVKDGTAIYTHGGIEE